MANEEIPEDLRLLENFPMYDTTFQDGPKLRQNLTLWATKTEEVSASIGRPAITGGCHCLSEYSFHSNYLRQTCLQACVYM